MAIDIGSLFGKAEDAAKQGMNDLLKQGGNAGLGFLEGKAVAIIQQDQAKNEAAVQQSIQDNLNTPTAPGSFGAYLSNLAQAPALKTYGPYILGAALGIFVLSRVMR